MPPIARGRGGRKVIPLPKQKPETKEGATKATPSAQKKDPVAKKPTEQHDKKPATNGATGAEAKKPKHKSLTGLTPLTGPFKEGQIIPYPRNHKMRTAFSKEELEEKDKLLEPQLECFRRAAEVHRKARKWAKDHAKPGIKLIDFVRQIENRSLDMLGGGHTGLAFPCGVSINECAAHYTPLEGDERVLKQGDVMKVDFGTHVNGYLIDSAFTIHFDDKFDPLANASHEATNNAIKAAGVDARLDEIGELVEETIKSYEVEIDGKVYKCKPVRNLSGHQVGRYHVHAGKSVPLCRGSEPEKMLEGEMYAIETFASTGNGYVNDSGECSHWMLSETGAHVMPSSIRQASAKKLLSQIQSQCGTLAFSQRWFSDKGFENVDSPMRLLLQKGIVDDYPPLSDVHNSYVSQFEHTIAIKASGVEVLSRGSDY